MALTFLQHLLIALNFGDVLKNVQRLKHKGHKFYSPEKFHLQLEIKSLYLSSLTRINAQKMIMKVLSEDLKKKIHALEIRIEK